MAQQRADERELTHDTSVEVVDVESGVAFGGRCHDVSAHGLSFDAALEPPVGAQMHVHLRSASENTHGELEVTRVEKQASGFKVSGRFARAP